MLSAGMSEVVPIESSPRPAAVISSRPESVPAPALKCRGVVTYPGPAPETVTVWRWSASSPQTRLTRTSPIPGPAASTTRPT